MLYEFQPSFEAEQPFLRFYFFYSVLIYFICSYLGCNLPWSRMPQTWKTHRKDIPFFFFCSVELVLACVNQASTLAPVCLG